MIDHLESETRRVNAELEERIILAYKSFEVRISDLTGSKDTDSLGLIPVLNTEAQRFYEMATEKVVSAKNDLLSLIKLDNQTIKNTQTIDSEEAFIKNYDLQVRLHLREMQEYVDRVICTVASQKGISFNTEQYNRNLVLTTIAEKDANLGVQLYTLQFRAGEGLSVEDISKKLSIEKARYWISDRVMESEKPHPIMMEMCWSQYSKIIIEPLAFLVENYENTLNETYNILEKVVKTKPTSNS